MTSTKKAFSMKNAKTARFLRSFSFFSFSFSFCKTRIVLLWAGLVHEIIQPLSWVAFVEAQPGNQIMLCEETALTAEEWDTFT